MSSIRYSVVESESGRVLIYKGRPPRVGGDSYVHWTYTLTEARAVARSILDARIERIRENRAELGGQPLPGKDVDTDE